MGTFVQTFPPDHMNDWSEPMSNRSTRHHQKGIGMFEKSMHVSQTEAERREAHEKANEWWHSTEAKQGAVEWLKAHYPESTWDDPVHHRSFQVAVCRLNLTVAHYRTYGHPDFEYDDLTRDNLADVMYYAGVESPLLDLPPDYSDFFRKEHQC